MRFSSFKQLGFQILDQELVFQKGDPQSHNSTSTIRKRVSMNDWAMAGLHGISPVPSE